MTATIEGLRCPAWCQHDAIDDDVFRHEGVLVDAAGVRVELQQLWAFTTDGQVEDLTGVHLVIEGEDGALSTPATPEALAELHAALNAASHLVGARHDLR